MRQAPTSSRAEATVAAMAPSARVSLLRCSTSRDSTLSSILIQCSALKFRNPYAGGASLAAGQDLLPGALLVELLRGLDGLEAPTEGLGREPCHLGAVEEDDGRIIDPQEDDDHGASGAVHRRNGALSQDMPISSLPVVKSRAVTAPPNQTTRQAIRTSG